MFDLNEVFNLVAFLVFVVTLVIASAMSKRSSSQPRGNSSAWRSWFGGE